MSSGGRGRGSRRRKSGPCPGREGCQRAEGAAVPELLWRAWECLVGTEEYAGRGLTRADMWPSETAGSFLHTMVMQ